MEKLCYNSFMVKNQKVKPEVAKEPQPSETKKVATEENVTKKKKFQHGKHPMPAVLRVTLALLFLIVMAIFLTWFMIWRTNMCDAEKALEFIREKPDLATYNYLVILGMMTVLAAITWRPFLSTGIVFIVLSIISFVQIQKYQLRAEPFLPEEIQLAENAGELTSFVEMDKLIGLIFGIVFILVGSILVEYFVRRIVGRNTKRLPWWDKMALVPRITFTMMTLAVMASIVRPVLQRRDLDWMRDLEFVSWNQTENYEKNGFILGFMYNLGNQVTQPPENYNEETMLKIAEKYETLAAADTERVDWQDEVDNVVVILAETFYDPALLTKYYPHTGGDVTPNLHKIFRNYPSGYMYSPEYGGSTANVEFEVMTGLTNYWARLCPYVNVVSKVSNFPSVAQTGKEFDFATTAVHSYDGSMYKRNLAYANMEYDEFLDEKKMTFTEKENEAGVINDRSIYREIIKLLEDNDQPQVIGAVTMQNHGPYNQANYPELDFKLLEPMENDWAIEASYQSLYYADQYLGEFLEELDDLNERTVVLWFGDHAMGMLDEYIHSEQKADVDTAHLTPYFIYANFEIESPYTVREVAELAEEEGLYYDSVRGIDLPTTTPNCLQNTMYNVLNLKKPAMFYILDEVCEQTPILTNVYLEGRMLEQTEALKDYELLNYDVMFGKRYWK